MILTVRNVIHQNIVQNAKRDIVKVFMRVKAVEMVIGSVIPVAVLFVRRVMVKLLKTPLVNLVRIRTVFYVKVVLLVVTIAKKGTIYAIAVLQIFNV